MPCAGAHQPPILTRRLSAPATGGQINLLPLPRSTLCPQPDLELERTPLCLVGPAPLRWTWKTTAKGGLWSATVVDSAFKMLVRSFLIKTELLLLPTPLGYLGGLRVVVSTAYAWAILNPVAEKK